MSDTLNFLDSSPEGNVSSDIDLEALAANLDSLSDDELGGICNELDLPDFETADEARTAIRAYLAEDEGTANVTDITHAPAESAGRDAAPLVKAKPGREVYSDEIDNRVVNTGRLWWQNPYTGNKIPHGQNDVDGMANVDGFAKRVPMPNPIERPPVYDDVIVG